MSRILHLKDVAALDNRRSSIANLALLGLFCILVFYLYGLELPLRRDNAQYIYSAQRLLNGEMPYQSLFDMKTPLTSILTAPVFYFSQAIFTDALTGVRLFYMGLCISTIYLIYIFVQNILPDNHETLLAPLFMIGLHGYVLQSSISAEPKLILLFFFVIGLILLLKKKWFWLGSVASLCAFTWQPSGVLFLSALAYASVQPRPNLSKAVLPLIAGFLVPSAVIFGAFLLTGTFKDLIQGTLIVHFYLERPNENEALIIAKMLPFGFPFSFPILVSSLAVFVICSARNIWAGGRTDIHNNPYFPLLLMFVVFAIASLLDFQSYPDLFVFLPFGALGVVLLYEEIRAVIEKKLSARAVSQKLLKPISYAILIAIPFLNASFANVFSNHAAIWRSALAEQKETYSQIVIAALGSYRPESNIIVIGVPEIPALLGFRNGTRHVSLGSVQGYDAFIASNYSDGFAGWLEEMKQSKPEMVMVKVSDTSGYSEKNRAQLFSWLNDNFRKLSSNSEYVSNKFRSDGIETWIAQK